MSTPPSPGASARARAWSELPTGPGAAGDAVIDPAELAFRARALAQAHPLSAPASDAIDVIVDAQCKAQPSHDIGSWVASALLAGYCLRRVEEAVAGVRVQESGHPRAPAGIDPDVVERIAAAVRGDGAAPWLLDALVTVGALDRIIASELYKRANQGADCLSPDAWTELEKYLTWWVVEGYALRSAEGASLRWR